MKPISVSQAATILQVSPDTVRRWADDGDLPATRTPGGQRRFLLHDVEALARHRSRSILDGETTVAYLLRVPNATGGIKAEIDIVQEVCIAQRWSTEVIYDDVQPAQISLPGFARVLDMIRDRIITRLVLPRLSTFPFLVIDTVLHVCELHNVQVVFLNVRAIQSSGSQDSDTVWQRISSHAMALLGQVWQSIDEQQPSE